MPKIISNTAIGKHSNTSWLFFNYIIHIMWSFLYHEAQPFNFSAVFISGGHNIDASGVDATVTQDIRKLGNILLHTVKCPSKQLSQIVRKYFAFLDPSSFTKLFHLPPDTAAV